MIDLNLLGSDFDLYALREAIRSAQRFASASAWAGYIIGPVENLTSDEDVDEWLRSSSGSAFHPVGSAGMSARDADYGVVDPDLNVKGVHGLRIVDASVVVRSVHHCVGIWRLMAGLFGCSLLSQQLTRKR